MYMPDRENATVEDSKIREYLLNPQHPDGGSKAMFFLRAGFGPEQDGEFRELLLEHATRHQVSKTEQTRFGTKYIIDGPAEAPGHFLFHLRTVWIAAVGSGHPKLVTAYPLTP